MATTTISTTTVSTTATPTSAAFPIAAGGASISALPQLPAAAGAVPLPPQSPAQVEKAYKALTTSTTVTKLDKDGNGDKGKDVRFTCKISNFVKDDSGNTAGANVDAPDYSSGVVQISFPDGTDLSKL